MESISKRKFLIISGGVLVLIGFLLFISAAVSIGFSNTSSGQAALVKLSGTITPTSSGFGSSGITPEQVREINQKVRTRNFDAVVYEINSGGGAVVASKEIKRSIEDMEVPTVCRFRDISASGAYMIAMGCDRIVADSATITGSVGVTSSYLEYSDALERVGVDYVNISAGEYKEAGSPYSNVSEKEKEMLRDMATDIQKEFIQIVKDNRNLTGKQLEEIKTAKIFLGEEAKNLSMVDSLGGRGQAVDSAEYMTSKDLKLKKVGNTQTPSILSLLFARTGVNSALNKLGLGNNVQTPLKAKY